MQTGRVLTLLGYERLLAVLPKIREAFRIDRAFLMSRHLVTSPQDLQYRTYILSQAMINVKAFRRQ
jgi:hypothetical protein